MRINNVKKRKIYPVTIFMIFMLFMFTFLAFYFYYKITVINTLKEVYDNGQEVQAVIVDVITPSKPGAPINLKYEYIDEDGFKYTGYCYRFNNYEEAKSYIGKEVTIKIYNHLSYQGDERPNIVQMTIAAILFTVLDVALLTVLIIYLKSPRTKKTERAEESSKY